MNIKKNVVKLITFLLKFNVNDISQYKELNA